MKKEKDEIQEQSKENSKEIVKFGTKYNGLTVVLKPSETEFIKTESGHTKSVLKKTAERITIPAGTLSLVNDDNVHSSQQTILSDGEIIRILRNILSEGTSDFFEFKSEAAKSIK